MLCIFQMLQVLVVYNSGCPFEFFSGCPRLFFSGARQRLPAQSPLYIAVARFSCCQLAFFLSAVVRFHGQRLSAVFLYKVIFKYAESVDILAHAQRRRIAAAPRQVAAAWQRCTSRHSSAEVSSSP